jgi:hypothetical protein
VCVRGGCLRQHLPSLDGRPALHTSAHIEHRTGAGIALEDDRWLFNTCATNQDLTVQCNYTAMSSSCVRRCSPCWCAPMHRPGRSAVPLTELLSYRKAQQQTPGVKVNLGCYAAGLHVHKSSTGMNVSSCLPCCPLNKGMGSERRPV